MSNMYEQELLLSKQIHMVCLLHGDTGYNPSVWGVEGRRIKMNLMIPLLRKEKRTKGV